MKALLPQVIAAVEAEGVHLREEFYRPGGPRGSHGDAPIDREIEERLREKLQALLPAAFTGEETGTTPGAEAGWVWLVDPQDGTHEFLQGRRGSAISVALLRGGEPVLGVVHSPLSPDRGSDTIAWAEGSPQLLRNGIPVVTDLSQRRLAPGEVVYATASSALRPQTWSLAVAPARYIALPSIAYRLARVAAGDGVATLSTHGVSEYDIAAGMALLRPAGGVTLDAEGRTILLTGQEGARVSGVFGGAPHAAQKLAHFDWKLLEKEPPRPARVALGFGRAQDDARLQRTADDARLRRTADDARLQRTADDARLRRAQGVLLGQVIGDSLGALVEFKGAREIAQRWPGGLRQLADGGPYHTMAGQPTDDSEMALALARTLVRNRRYDANAVLDAYRAWLTTRPVDVGATTERGLLGLHTTESESNGSLMRISPAGVWAAGDPERAARVAREDSVLTHRNPVCVEACAGYAAAVAAGVGGATAAQMLRAALDYVSGQAREAIERGAAGTLPEFEKRPAWVLIALQNAFYWLASGKPVEEALVATVGAGGDTDTNAAIAGALLGALQGRPAFPERWIRPVLACRPLSEAGALRPRPMDYWPDDLLDLAEALLAAAG